MALVRGARVPHAIGLGVAIADAGDVSRALAGCQRAKQPHGRLFAFAHHHEVDGRLAHGVLRRGAEVLAAADDGQVRPRALDGLHQASHRGPAEAPHVANADGLGVRRDARDDLLVTEAQPRQRPLPNGLIRRLADGVDHAHVVPRLA